VALQAFESSNYASIESSSICGSFFKLELAPRKVIKEQEPAGVAFSSSRNKAKLTLTENSRN